MSKLGKKSNQHTVSSRNLLSTIALPSLLALSISAMAAETSSSPLMAQGIQIGDLAPGKAVIWSRSDKPARMMVEYANNQQFTHSIVVRGPYALENTDYTARQDLVDLPEGSEVFVKVWFEDLTNARTKSEPVIGHFKTIGKQDDIRFVSCGVGMSPGKVGASMKHLAA